MVKYDKKKVLVLNGQYAPGYKGGGPTQSCINMVENLYEYFDFFVLCADCDYKEDTPYENVNIDEWNQVGHARVFYASKKMQSLKGFSRILNSIDYDILYLNGFFSPIFTIKPLILRRSGNLKNKKTILTPRGDFTGGCENKKIKKYSYIYMTKMLGLYKNLIWHATSELEKKDILKKYNNAEIIVATNMSARFVKKKLLIKKKIGELRLVFLSRIFPKKNIKYALEVLQTIKDGNIIFDIYGPMEDKSYWSECEEIISKLPSNILVSYKGEVLHNDISNIFQQYHAFFFPTLGENYGHVIVEAMMNNCLCVLSKGVTPWDDYIDNTGLGCELANKYEFSRIIQRLVNMDQNQIYKLLEYNDGYIEQKTNIKGDLEIYKKMLGE